MSTTEKCLAADGLPARATGAWVHDKLGPLERYAGMVSTSMRAKFPSGVVFIDLMAGPGRCVETTTPGRPECDGSTLIALRARFPFASVVSIESNPESASALRQRAGHHPTLRVIESDCNHPDTIAEVRRVCDGALSLMFVDLLGTEVKFSTIKEITRSRSVDIVVTWPEMDLNRNRGLSLERPERMNDFFGTNQWQTIAKEIGPMRRLRAYQRLYVHQLEQLGYLHNKFTSAVKNRRRGVLYRPFFASRNELGLRFWNAASADVSKPTLFPL